MVCGPVTSRLRSRPLPQPLSGSPASLTRQRRLRLGRCPERGAARTFGHAPSFYPESELLASLPGLLVGSPRTKALDLIAAVRGHGEDDRADADEQEHGDDDQERGPER